MVSSASCVYQHIEGTTSARSWDHPLQDCDSEGLLQLGCLGPSGSVSLLCQRGLLVETSTHPYCGVRADQCQHSSLRTLL